MITKGVINKNYRTTTRTTTKITSSYKIHSISTQDQKNKSPFTSISSIGNNLQKIHKKINMNDELLHRRKENYLNTQYNKRITLLKEITKENKKIYERINLQKSLYSQDDMRKSTASIRSLSKSTSRVSNKSNMSQRKRNTKTTRTAREKAQVKIQPESVNNIKASNISQFKSMFLRQKNQPTTNYNSNFNINSISLQTKKQNRSFSLRQEPRTNKTQGMGNMLHKIVQQMYQVPPNKTFVQNKKRLLY